MTIDSVEDCVSFFKKGYPESKPKNVRTQLGVVFEEFGELLKALEAENATDEYLLAFLHASITSTANHFKTTDGNIVAKNRVELLDGICDVMVTAIGLGYHLKMDVLNGFREVNRSNNSKFDENGNPVLDNNLKLVKSSLYSKPDLKPFV